TLADGTFEGIVIHRDGEIIDSNAAVSRIVGSRHDDRRVERLTDFMDEADAARLMRAGADGPPLELTLRRGAGERFPAEVSCRAIRLTDGTQGQLLAIRDIAQRKRSEARLNHLAL